MKSIIKSFLLLSVFFIGSGLFVGVALAASGTPSFTASITPATAAPGSSQSYSILITNTSTSDSRKIASFRVAIPSGFMVSTFSASSWATSTSPGFIELATTNGSWVSQNASIAVSFVATAPAATGTSTFAVSAWEETNFKSPFNAPGSQPTVRVSQIVKVTPEIIWNNPSDITYGTTLSTSSAPAQLNATTTTPIAGTFAYTPDAGTVLLAGQNQTLNVIFTPNSTSTYNIATSSVKINVLKANPSVVWNNPSTITYGTALTATQLNATSTNVAGTFAYTPSLGAVLNAGSQSLAAIFTPSNANYATTSASASVFVMKVTPAISWATPAPIAQGTALGAAELNATSSVAGTFTYNPASGAVLNPGNNQMLGASFAPADSVNYNSASAHVFINILDTEAPVIAARADILGVQATSNAGAVVTYTSPDATDNVDGTLPANCTPFSGTAFALGTTTVTCTKSDTAGNDATSTVFIVEVVDTTGPTITLTGSNPQQIVLGQPYVELGATVADNHDLSPVLSISTSTLDISAPGIYTVTYTAVDALGNPASAVNRTVEVLDQEAPVITLLGAIPQYIEAPGSYTELGSTVSDNFSKDLIATASSSQVDGNVLGSYVVTYTVEDGSLNGATTTRAVIVRDTTKPSIALNGATTTLKVGESYLEAGATASDTFDTSVTSGSVQIVSTVNTAIPGTYSVTYTATDGSGNSASVMRTVVVYDLGSDSSLSSLTVSQGTLAPAFSSATFAYAVMLPFDATTTPSIAATVAHAFARSTTTDAIDITSTSTADRTSTVIVTAENNASSTTYTVVFDRAAAPDTSAPVITITGSSTINIFVGDNYVDAGATALDNGTVDLTASIIATSTVSTSTAGTYAVTYTVEDAARNAATSTRTVIVSNRAPVTPAVTTTGTTGGGTNGGHRHDVDAGGGSSSAGTSTTTVITTTAGSGNPVVLAAADRNPALDGNTTPATPEALAAGLTAQGTTTATTTATTTELAANTDQTAAVASAGNWFTRGYNWLWALLAALVIGGVAYFIARRRNA